MSTGKPIGKKEYWAIVTFASICDLITLIPVGGDFVGPIYWFIMGIYFYFKGYGLVNGKKLVPWLLSLIAELIPIIQEGPALVIGTVVLLNVLKLEQKTGINITSKGPGGKVPIGKAAAGAVPPVLSKTRQVVNN